MFFVRQTNNFVSVKNVSGDLDLSKMRKHNGRDKRTRVTQNQIIEMF